MGFPRRFACWLASGVGPLRVPGMPMGVQLVAYCLFPSGFWDGLWVAAGGMLLVGFADCGFASSGKLLVGLLAWGLLGVPRGGLHTACIF